MRIGLFTDTYTPDINGVVSSIVTLQKELESKLEKIDPKLKSELRKLEDLYTSLECVELEIYFAKGFKEGVKFLKDCL